ncbi:MAG: 6-phosphogluconolactonase [Phycisphaerales bacterium]
MHKPQIEIARDSQDLAERMVQLFLAAADDAIASGGVFRTALSGGRTPERFLERLANTPQAQDLPWDRVHLFWVDERCVPPDAQASNYRLVAETLLSRISIPAVNVHRIPTESEDRSGAARAYERTIREVFGLGEGEIPQFDLIVLGMGSDGHTASLFPNSPAVRCVDHLTCVVPAGSDVRLSRITLTKPVLLAARRLVVLVSGGEKARTLEAVLTGEPNEMRYPVQVLWPVLERVIWLVDHEAGSLMVDV